MEGKRKKVLRFRGYTTHGYGSKKKNRGSGNRGGCGMAGTGKRADQKKPSVHKGYFGKHGFIPKVYTRKLAINVHELSCFGPEVDLTKLGFDKLLGKGKAVKQTVIVAEASPRAIEKIEAAGGKVVLRVENVHPESS